MRSYQILCLLVLSLSFSNLSQGQEKVVTSPWSQIQDDFKIKTSLGFQLWSTYTYGQHVYNDENQSYQEVDNRWNNQIRRSRLSVSGQPYEQLKFKLTASLDLVGRDEFAATQGGHNNENRGQFGLWNMLIQWKVFKSKEYLYLSAGYQVPTIGRESITAALKSTSFEKSWSQNYLRRTIVGTGPGRAMGINLGGQKTIRTYFSFDYNIGLFTPQKFSSVANSQGLKSSPLLVSRLGLHFGDPESKTYSKSFKVNYFGERKGLSLAIAQSYQGQTDSFYSNRALGLDGLFNWNMIQVDGEWTIFTRTIGQAEGQKSDVSNQSGYLRVGYNIKMGNGSFIEPVIMWTRFQGAMTIKEHLNAIYAGMFAGKDQILDFTLNYHLNKSFKISINYTKNSGASGELQEVGILNNYFQNGNKDAIQRGDMLGMGLVIVMK